MAVDGKNPPVDVPGEGRLHARIETTLGTMTAVLYEEETPETVANFVGLATGTKAYADPRTDQAGAGPYYDGTLFHRVIPGFMIQGGDPTGTGRGGPGFTFRDEFNPRLRHSGAGVLSMANRGPNTNGSQFFITEGPTPHLDNRHTVFGQVVDGVAVVRAIANVPRDRSDKPLEDVRIVRVTFFRQPQG